MRSKKDVRKEKNQVGFFSLLFGVFKCDKTRPLNTEWATESANSFVFIDLQFSTRTSAPTTAASSGLSLQSATSPLAPLCVPEITLG